MRTQPCLHSPAETALMHPDTGFKLLHRNFMQGLALLLHILPSCKTLVVFLPAAFPLSEDHKPNRTDERQRIESAGGVVVWAGTWRVGGVLAVSRAFGECPCTHAMSTT